MQQEMFDREIMLMKLFFTALVAELPLQFDAATGTCFCRLAGGGSGLNIGGHDWGLRTRSITQSGKNKPKKKTASQLFLLTRSEISPAYFPFRVPAGSCAVRPLTVNAILRAAMSASTTT